MGLRSLSARTLRAALACALVAVVAGVTASAASATVITALPSDFAATEHASFDGQVASFESDNPDAAPADFTTTIDWGDGSATTTGVININDTEFAVYGTHTYADDGSYTVTVTISDQAPGAGTATATSTATVADTDAPITGSAACPGPAVVGSPASYSLGSFSVADPAAQAADLTATVNWGDTTTSVGTISTVNGSFAVSGNHAYAAAGPYTITVTIADDAPGTATAQITTTTAPCIAGVAGKPFSATEGKASTATVATFTVPDVTATASAYSATINWGDASSSAGVVSGGAGSFSVSGTHTYAEEGSHPITVTVTQTTAPSNSGSASSTASVSDGTIAAAPVSEPHPAPRSVSGALATFHDANPGATPADFTVTIDWGDGGSPSTGTVTGARGDFIVSGTHTYSKSATYAIKVHVADAGGASADTTVSYAALNATTTKLACAPAAVRAGRFTTCTITVRDRARAGAVTPTGTVTAKSTGAGVFRGVPCKLRATRASGRASCKFSYKPKAVGSGSQVITAIYRGDRAHARSSAKASLRVGRR